MPNCRPNEAGQEKIEWAAAHMPLLNQLRDELAQEQPLANHRIGMSIHLEAKTANLAVLLRDWGASVSVTGSNPLSTQDDVAMALGKQDRISVHARRGVTKQEYFDHLQAVLSENPDLILDDGGDLVKLLHEDTNNGILGGCEETTTGVHRLRQLARDGKLQIPMFAVNDAKMKHLFDNRYGTGQSVWDGIMRATNLLIAGKEVLVAGYGWCGRGIAMRAKGLGAQVSIAEVNPVRAIEAVMDGFDVSPLTEAIKDADFLVTATGCRDIVTEAALRNAKDGLVLANAGHFNVEVDPTTLAKLAEESSQAREGIEEFILANGRRLYLLGEGRLVNLVLGDGHPTEIMDISFAVQALTLKYVVDNQPLTADLHAVPSEIDTKVATMKLAALGVEIDKLTDSQLSYLGLA